MDATSFNLCNLPPWPSRGRSSRAGSRAGSGWRRPFITNLNATLEMPYNDNDAGNGALMRLLPTALFTLGDDQLLARYAIEQARLTHHHPLSDAACLCVGRSPPSAMAPRRVKMYSSLREFVSRSPRVFVILLRRQVSI